jgi:2-dehydropantoate 2-reductase
MRHFDVLTARFGEDRVLGGLCRINTTVDYRGRVVQFNELHELWYGERNGTQTARIQELHQQMSGAGFDAHLSTTILAKLWEKWTLLATIGGICCLMRAELGEVARASGGVDFSMRFFDEVIAVATAAGFAPDASFVTTTRGWLSQVDSTQTTSMYRDLVKGGPIEGQQIVGDLVTEAQRGGVDAPLLAAAWTHLSVYQSRPAGHPA